MRIEDQTLLIDFQMWDDEVQLKTQRLQKAENKLATPR